MMNYQHSYQSVIIKNSIKRREVSFSEGWIIIIHSLTKDNP